MRQNSRTEAYRDFAIVAALNHAMLFVIAFVGGLALDLPAVLLLSVGFAMGGVTILHHAGHRRFSPQYPVNMLVVQLAVPTGLWVDHWTQKHRVHHKVPAVYPDDSFTRVGAILRFHPAAPRLPWHRYQHYYAWATYALIWVSDLGSQIQFLFSGVVSGLGRTEQPGRRACTFLLEKAAAIGCIAPYFVFGTTGRVLAAVAVALVVGGFLTATVVAVGHINVGLEYRSAEETQLDWVGHVLATTVSFDTRSTFMAFLTGGLTHHAAHHLRPVATRRQLRQVHETLASSATAARLVEFGSFFAALKGHQTALKRLGSADTSAEAGRVSATASA